jgi:hypothetical protein
MSSIALKSCRNVVLAAFLVAGCGGAELSAEGGSGVEQASEPCEYGQAFMEAGLEMVMKDGQLTVVPREGEVQAAYLGWDSTDPRGPVPQANCVGCH